MYKQLSDYFKNKISNTIVFHDETSSDYVVNIIRITVLPINAKKYPDRDKGKTFLALKYPTDNHEIDLFMDSPLNYVQYYKYFKGVFVVDLSDYADNLESKNIDRLIEYINSSNKEMKFVLLISCSINDREKIFKRFESKLLIDKFDLSIPEQDELKEYFTNSIKEKYHSLSIEPSNIEHLFEKEFEMNKITSYGDVDAIINKITRILINNSNADADTICGEIRRYTESRKTKKQITIGF